MSIPGFSYAPYPYPLFPTPMPYNLPVSGDDQSSEPSAPPPPAEDVYPGVSAPMPPMAMPVPGFPIGPPPPIPPYLPLSSQGFIPDEIGPYLNASDRQLRQLRSQSPTLYSQVLTAKMKLTFQERLLKAMERGGILGVQMELGRGPNMGGMPGMGMGMSGMMPGMNEMSMSSMMNQYMGNMGFGGLGMGLGAGLGMGIGSMASMLPMFPLMGGMGSMCHW